MTARKAPAARLDSHSQTRHSPANILFERTSNQMFLVFNRILWTMFDPWFDRAQHEKTRQKHSIYRAMMIHSIIRLHYVVWRQPTHQIDRTWYGTVHYSAYDRRTQLFVVHVVEPLKIQNSVMHVFDDWFLIDWFIHSFILHSIGRSATTSSNTVLLEEPVIENQLLITSSKFRGIYNNNKDIIILTT